jgi:TM2 domain-containing membrane protein YozV
VTERRKKKDIWSFILVFLNIFSWIFLLIILLIFHHAQPEFETFFDRFYQLKIRTFWQIKYTYLLIYLVISGLIISAAGMMISHYRARRKNDHWCSLIIMAGVSIILMMIALFHL